jgi:hypothetical protein
LLHASPLNSEPKNNTPKATPRIPKVNIATPPALIFSFAAILAGGSQGRVNRAGESDARLAER